MPKLVISHDPIGTLEEVIKHGYNPADVGSCAPSDQNKVRGCAFYEACAFQRDGYGVAPNCTAFRGQGPENVPYFKSIVDSRGNVHEKEDYCPCYVWMHSLAAPAAAGDRTGELIEIIGRQGDTITLTETLPVAPGPHSKDIRLKTETKDFIVPKFQHPWDGVDGQVLNVREKIRAGREARLKRQREEAHGLEPAEPEAEVRKKRFKYGQQ